jgi:hypothetical protein
MREIPRLLAQKPNASPQRQQHTLKLAKLQPTVLPLPALMLRMLQLAMPLSQHWIDQLACKPKTWLLTPAPKPPKHTMWLKLTVVLALSRNNELHSPRQMPKPPPTMPR